MREGGNVENITHNTITVRSHLLVVVVVSSSEKLNNSCFMGGSPGDVSEEPVM